MQHYLTFDDVLLVPQLNDISSRRDVSISNDDKQYSLFMKFPVISSNMDTITESGMANYMSSIGGRGALHRFMDVKRNVHEFEQSPKNTLVSVGVVDSEKERFDALYEAGARNFIVDVAHGHSKLMKDKIRWIKDRAQDKVLIIAGNVCTYDGAKFLEDSGANLVKVGVGNGSACSTRIKTGHGVPQFSALRECSKVGISVISDGGIRTAGDLVKAYAAGADFAMVGGLLAGTYYTPPVQKLMNNSQMCFEGFQVPSNSDDLKVQYRGMASKEANVEFYGEMSDWKTAEGVSTTVNVKYLHETNELIQDLKGGLRSGLTYSGCKTIKELQHNAKFVTITGNGLIESNPHILNR